MEKSAVVYENTIELMKKEMDVLKVNLKQAKFLLRQTSELNLEKDLKINQLEKENSNFVGDQLYEEFANKFTKEELKGIRSVHPGEQNDSKFVSLMMESLYKNDEKQKLKNRSATGKKYRGEQKLEISMEKKDTMRQMLDLRLKYELPGASTASEFKRRLDKLNAYAKWYNQSSVAVIGTILPA